MKHDDSAHSLRGSYWCCIWTYHYLCHALVVVVGSQQCQQCGAVGTECHVGYSYAEDALVLSEVKCDVELT